MTVTVFLILSSTLFSQSHVHLYTRHSKIPTPKSDGCPKGKLA